MKGIVIIYMGYTVGQNVGTVWLIIDIHRIERERKILIILSIL